MSELARLVEEIGATSPPSSWAAELKRRGVTQEQLRDFRYGNAASLQRHRSTLEALETLQALFAPFITAQPDGSLPDLLTLMPPAEADQVRALIGKVGILMRPEIQAAAHRKD